MQAIDRLLITIRRRETPWADRLYRLAARLRRLHVPVVPGLHHVLYEERRLRHTLLGTLARLLYYEPLFRTRCERVGRNFRLIGGLPVLMGAPIRIRVGDNVTLSGVTTIVGSKQIDAPTLEIGDGSYIGYQSTLVTGRGITIGRHVLIANRVVLVADDGHPLEAEARIAGRPSPAQDIGSIRIGDAAWIAENAVVLKNVEVGEGAVVAAGAVVTKDVPPYTVAAGNPARVVRELRGGR